MLPVWIYDGLTYHPLVRNGTPSVGTDCCCEIEMCAESAYWWSVEKATTPSEYLNDNWAFGYPNWDVGGVGDQSRSGTVYGGPLRYSHVGIRFADVQADQGDTFVDVRLTIPVQAKGFGDPIDCSGHVDIVIKGGDMANMPPFLSIPSLQWLDDVRTIGHTANSVDWLGEPKADPVQCGISQVTTPNFAATVNDIIGRPDWVRGNALLIILEGRLTHITSASGTYTLNQLAGTMTRHDGGSFIADGFAIGQNIRVEIAGDPLWINCVLDVGVDYLKWSIGPAWWPNNADRFVNLDAYAVVCTGFAGAQTPAAVNGDFLLSMSRVAADHCLIAK